MNHLIIPDTMWYLCIHHLAELSSICSDGTLPDAIPPLQRRLGVTIDISQYLQFYFWQPVLFLDHEQSWPSTIECSGFWVGIAHNIGDFLTFWIVDAESFQVLAHSVVRPFNCNKQVTWNPKLLSTSNQLWGYQST